MQLGTHDVRIPAINMYLKFGFETHITDAESRAAWERVAQKIDHPLLREALGE